MSRAPPGFASTSEAPAQSRQTAPSEPVSVTLPSYLAAPNSLPGMAALSATTRRGPVPQLEVDPPGSQAHAAQSAEAASSSLQSNSSKQGSSPNHQAALTGGWDSLLPDLETGVPSVVAYNPGNAGGAQISVCTFIGPQHLPSCAQHHSLCMLLHLGTQRPCVHWPSLKRMHPRTDERRCICRRVSCKCWL